MKKYIAIWDANQQISVNAIKSIIEHEDAKLLLFYDKENNYNELINNDNVAFINLEDDSVEALYQHIQDIDVLNQFIVIDKNLTDDFVFSDPSDIEANIDIHFKKPATLLRRLLPLLARYPGQKNGHKNGLNSENSSESKKYRIQLFQVHSSEHQQENTSPLDTYFYNVINQTPFTHLNYKSTFVFDKYKNFFGQLIVDVIEDNSVYFMNDYDDNNIDSPAADELSHHAVENHSSETNNPAETNSFDNAPDVVALNQETSNANSSSIDSPLVLPEGEESVDHSVVSNGASYDSNMTQPEPIAPPNPAIAQNAVASEPADAIQSTPVRSAPVDVPSAPMQSVSVQSTPMEQTPVQETMPSQANVQDHAVASEVIKLAQTEAELQAKINKLKQEYLDILAKKNRAEPSNNDDLTESARLFKEQAMSMAKSPVQEFADNFQSNDDHLQPGMAKHNVEKKNGT